jgi:hypothetical protein
LKYYWYTKQQFFSLHESQLKRNEKNLSEKRQKEKKNIIFGVSRFGIAKILPPFTSPVLVRKSYTKRCNIGIAENRIILVFFKNI